MKYMVLIYQDEQLLDRMSRAEMSQFVDEFTEFTRGLKESGKWISSGRLQFTGSATSVRVRDGKRLITDGPFAETREQLGGYYLIDARDLDEAVAIASRVPAARNGTVEVRPLFEVPVAAPTA